MAKRHLVERATTKTKAIKTHDTCQTTTREINKNKLNPEGRNQPNGRCTKTTPLGKQAGRGLSSFSSNKLIPRGATVGAEGPRPPHYCHFRAVLTGAEPVLDGDVASKPRKSGRSSDKESAEGLAEGWTRERCAWMKPYQENG